ncbi:Hypothetical predicted protein [Paramuricea clavata]|uniref:Uncharacterized protein n=1 Tax=Paramuricea clavata TaxID=317549 RepID=A0A6S7IZU1_PARCT|nr:Hypothetical predicted protein [Paramuricea clavata]
MSFAEEGSFYEETHEASSKEEKFMEATFDDKRYVVRRMSFEESFETFGAISSVEEPIEASFFEEHFASPKENRSKLERLLNEVSRNFQPFVVIGEIKERFAKKLNQQGIPVKEFDDFNLGIMGVLNGLDKGDPVGKFLRQAYIGCFQCSLCLQSDRELKTTSELLGHHLSNAMSVLRYVLSKQGISIPDSSSEKMDYDECKLNHLTHLTDSYLQQTCKSKLEKCDYEFLRRHLQLIKDFEVVSEIDFALRHLRDEFEELRRHPNEVSRRLNNFMLFSELEETTDLSTCCC